MSTDFTLYALPEAAVEDARRYAGTSLGYGNGDFLDVLAAAAAADAGGDRFAIFLRLDVARHVVERHITFHDDTDPCFSHALVTIVGPDFPVIDQPLIGRVREAMADWPGRGDAKSAHAALGAFLDGALGKRLWYVFE